MRWLETFVLVLMTLELNGLTMTFNLRCKRRVLIVYQFLGDSRKVCPFEPVEDPCLSCPVRLVLSPQRCRRWLALLTTTQARAVCIGELTNWTFRPCGIRGRPAFWPHVSIGGGCMDVSDECPNVLWQACGPAGTCLWIASMEHANAMIMSCHRRLSAPFARQELHSSTRRMGVEGQRCSKHCNRLYPWVAFATQNPF